jgi:hypothetical protein
MKNRLPLILSIAAVAIAVLGATPVGNAAQHLIFPAHSVGTRELKDDAVVGAKVKDGSLLAKDFKHGQLPAGPQGAQGPQGPQGPQGKQGPSGPVDTSKLLGRTVTVTASRSLQAGTRHTDYVVCPNGYEAVGGGAWGGPYDSSDGSVVVLWSAPRAAAGAPADSTNGPASTGWTTAVFNVSGLSEFVHWSAICAKIGA